jgi:hypothetical protein
MLCVIEGSLFSVSMFSFFCPGMLKSYFYSFEGYELAMSPTSRRSSELLYSRRWKLRFCKAGPLMIAVEETRRSVISIINIKDRQTGYLLATAATKDRQTGYLLATAATGEASDINAVVRETGACIVRSLGPCWLGVCYCILESCCLSAPYTN